jgi:competence protein ComEC
MPIAWRFAALGGGTAGLAISPLVPPGSRDHATAVLALALAAAFGLAVARPRERAPAHLVWLALVALAATSAGMATGALRLAAIDGGAFDGPLWAATARGFVTAVPRRSDGEVRVRIQTADGRLAVDAHEPVPDLPIGRQIVAAGTLRAPEPWEVDYLARYGISEVLAADRLRLTGARRGGVAGIADGIRDRAEAALGSGTPQPEAALLRGFVLGEDDRIDPATVEDFKRSGLAHLLAVSGDCVMLLSLLGASILGLLGVPLRARLLCLLALIAVYVPVTGAAPSIQRAGIMGAAGLIAALAGRPRSRWYAVLLAGAATLAINPRWVGDAGWQLSFAAVIGILLFAAGIRDLLLGHGAERVSRASPARRAFAEGAGITIAAGLATAPLFAHHFEAVSLVSLPANLLALPAIPAVMWLSMLAAIVGQIPGVPVEPLTALAGVLVAYVAQVAHWLAAPDWARVGITLPTWPAVAASYGVVCASLAVVISWARRRAGLGAPPGHPRALVAALGLALCALVVVHLGSRGASDAAPAPGLRVTVLDVGQGDAILLDPADGAPVLVDGGPPGDELRTHLESEGVSQLGAAIVTHDQSDHAGGIDELLGAFPVHRLLYALRGPDFLAPARAAGVATMPIAEGSEVDSGSLRIDVLWPPGAMLRGPPPADLNEAALILLARWRGFDMLLTADAEAEAVPIDPGPIDVLKVAHHGSDDAGLDALLDRTAPGLAVISVGAGNSYGHPTPDTLATLAEHGVPTLRTDEEGDVTIDVEQAGWSVETGG